MSDLQVLFLVLLIVYGWECACWLNRGSVAFRSWLGKRWRAVHPGALLGNQQGGFVFAHPLPPLGTLLTGTQFPLSLSPQAVLAYVATSVNPAGRPGQSGACFSWNAIRSVEARGKRVLVNGESIFKAPTPRLACRVAQALRQTKELTEMEREKLLRKELSAGFDASRISQEWREFKSHTRNLRLVANILFFYLFAFSPFFIWHFGLRNTWPFLVAVLIALTWSIALFFRREHKRLFPEAEEERFTHFIIILLSPVTAIRAADVLSRALLEMYHPLAVAKSICSTEQFEGLARAYWREVMFPALPVCPKEERLAVETELYARALLKEALEGFLHESGIDPTKLIQPPKPIDPTCLSYCPRCLAQFTTEEGNCADCGGIALASLKLPTREARKAIADFARQIGSGH